jgi:hypothetical protein
MSTVAAPEKKRAKASHVWERDGLDWYQEPEWVTRGLLRVEQFIGGIWDPACGGGNIVRAAASAGHEVMASDVVQRCDDALFTMQADFLTLETTLSPPNIIMNPPYFRAAGAEAFIRKAIELVVCKEGGGKVAAFVDHRFIAGKERAAGLFHEWPPSRIWQVTPRPSCPPGKWLEAGNKAGGGTADYVWLVWSFAEPNDETRFGWLRCEK